MCGIAGFNWKNHSVLENMTKAIKHRGPDDEGFYLDENVSLSNARLAVMDPSDNGHQPMELEHLVIVYNGEIYGFNELREQLRSEGRNFHSDTDTEVVLHSYHKWGPACVERFNGMWAFCIYDKQKNLLFLSRDRFGIKPLYYYFDGDKFIFASELKAIRQHNLDLSVNLSAVNFFFYQKYIGGDLTIFKNCYKLRPSENILFDLNSKKLTRTKYYSLEQQVAENQNFPLEERLKSVESIIVDAVEKRLVADVPVGSFLSGGLDSSLISAVISRKHKDFDTFSIGFKEDKSYDELKYSNLASEYIKTKHYYDYMQMDENTIGLVLKNMDEPFGDSSIIPTYLLSKITRRLVTASLSGDAADEIFAGYDTYKAFTLSRHVPAFIIELSKRLVDALPVSDRKVNLPFKMKRYVRNFDVNVNKRHLNWMATFNKFQRRKLLNENFVGAENFIPWGNEKTLLSIQLNDLRNYLAEDILKKVDMASMLNSLEVRVPYLDHRLVPLVLSLPEKYKINCLTTKYLLKKIASAYLPKEIVQRPKKGFTVPISRWIRKSSWIRDVLVNRRYYGHNLLSYEYVQQLFSSHMANKMDNARHLWLVFVFNYWMSHNPANVGSQQQIKGT
ncbi:MAG TPA: asparagine synthase (glutamine-hydrolyzing) [Sedimentisphaerales bacterium]|nr:asparagine synthase (glutamine-hydrolyzing) [Sedimentisphaerales bacterium]